MLITELVVYPWNDTRFRAQVQKIDPGDRSLTDINEYIQDQLIYLRAQDAFKSACLNACCIEPTVLDAFTAYMITEDADAFKQGYAFAAEWMTNQHEAYRCCHLAELVAVRE